MLFRSPTCTEKGFTTYICSRCGDSYVSEETEPLEHDYKDGVCTRCDAADPDYVEPDQPCDGGENCPSKAFRDVPGPSNWAHAGIDYCVKNKLMNGVGGDRFSPEGTVTRAQLVTILYRVAGSPETAFKGTFTDVADEQWYSLPIEWAAANGIVNGVGEGKFNPDGKITREQIAAILYRYSGSPKVEGSLAGFPDAASVSDYAVDAMIWATSTGLINGIGQGDVTILSPKTDASRAQIASIIMRYAES